MQSIITEIVALEHLVLQQLLILWIAIFTAADLNLGTIGNQIGEHLSFGVAKILVA